MKNLIIRTILSWILFTIPLIPLFVIEAQHKGTDLNQYGFYTEMYMRFLLILFGAAWYYSASKIVDNFLNKIK